MPMRKVIIVDVRGLIAYGGRDVIKRHEKYASALKGIVPDSELKVISVGPVSKDPLGLNFSIVSFRNLVSLINGGIKLLKEDSDKTVLVCGDPWESFYVARVICLFARKKIPIQIQLHADVGSPSWRAISWRNRLRYLFVKPAIRQATQVRFVSDQQKRLFEEAFVGVGRKSVVIPVPILVELEILSNRKNSSRNVLAFVGRVEIDRGIQQFLEIVSAIEESNLLARYWIIGEGSQEEWLKSEVLRMGFDEKFTFFGEVSQNSLSGLWPRIGCLISMAPSESYGRAVREALAHGVPVLAQRSSGLLELEEDFSGNGLVFLGNEDRKSIVSLVESAFDTIVPVFLSNKLLDSANTAPRLLATSWANLLGTNP